MPSNFMIFPLPKQHTMHSLNISSLQNRKMEFQKHIGAELIVRCCDLGVGMKLAIVSAAFMSSPVWIPPLMILLMIGFVFSVPFGVLFAVYATSRSIAAVVVRTAVANPVAEKDMEEEEGFDDCPGGGDVCWGEEREEGDKSREGKQEMGMTAFQHENAASTKTMALDRDVSFDSSSPVIGESPDTTPMTEEAACNIEVAVPNGNKEMINNEQQLWDQIEALRTIIGCKVEHNLELNEELNTLYLFTGVEPPLSSVSSFDLAEVNNKLQFLKSVIGVM